MKRFVSFLALLTGLSLAAAPRDDKSKTPPVDAVKAAFDKLVHADKDWRSTDAACKELVALGDKALDTVSDAAALHCDARVRLACYRLLTDTFAADGSAIHTVVYSGLNDKDEAIRYHCAFSLGERKVFSSHKALRAVLKKATDDHQERIRFAAAKSLAQLGEADVLPVLFEAVTDDRYMARSMGSAGLKALTGKNLDDFEGYKFGEGAVVTGGVEFTHFFDAVTTAETRARRYRAATAYFQWLRKERPELYKHVSYY